MNAKQKSVQDRIQGLEHALRMAREYLETGAHADWHRFQPFFKPKLKDGKALPPHKDWVKNVFQPRTEKALARAEAVLQRLVEHETRS